MAKIARSYLVKLGTILLYDGGKRRKGVGRGGGRRGRKGEEKGKRGKFEEKKNQCGVFSNEVIFGVQSDTC